jgi:predicted transposase/invertase (TIGR01784 family)
LVARTKQEIADAALREELIELIETVILYKLPRLNREEIQAMLQVSDIRQTRVYQEAKEEGRKEGIETERERNVQEKLRLIAKMAAMKMSAETIADLLGLDVDFVRKEMAKTAS